MSLDDDLEAKSASYQERVRTLRPMMARAFRKGVRTFNRRMSNILDAWFYQGGFESRAEAKAWLNLPVNYSELDLLREGLAGLPRDRAEQLFDEIERQAYAFRFNRQKMLAAMTKITADGIANAIIAGAVPVLGKVVKESYGRTMFEIQKGIGVGFSFNEIPASHLERVIDSQLSFSRAQGMAESMVAPMREAMFEGILTGKNTKDIARDVEKVLETSDYKARALSRTMLTEVSNEAEKRTLESTGLKKYMYRATLDERTCPVCGKLDGQVFLLKDAQPGVNFPPMHRNCRCVHTAVLSKEATQGLMRRARDSEHRTMTVPADMTYTEWRRKFID